MYIHTYLYPFTDCLIKLCSNKCYFNPECVYNFVFLKYFRKIPVTFYDYGSFSLLHKQWFVNSV